MTWSGADVQVVSITDDSSSFIFYNRRKIFQKSFKLMATKLCLSLAYCSFKWFYSAGVTATGTFISTLTKLCSNYFLAIAGESNSMKT
jgi:hypothetical protein